MDLEQAEEYYNKTYHNNKVGKNLNINKNLWIDYLEFCLKLSRKKNKTVTASARIRLLMISDMCENKF